MNPWFFWALASAGFAGLTAVLAKVGVSQMDSNLATAIRTTVILFFSWTLAFVTGPTLGNWPATLAALPRRSWLFLVLSGLATGLSWLCYFRALQLGPASRVAPVDKLSVVFAIALAACFLKEPLGWRQWVGGALILVGALVLSGIGGTHES